ncbi:BatD family protein [Shewanella sp. ULN5]|uniref:BatD family protein n=1 Tax=Shewanella sp. ULN5 TaxID=2994678 RepID=UPI00273E46EB|nr:BatD family protein [Shewanella sp. ULN5]MDP5145951.1 BatD family protein [Shewanella sp. ULN5]
MVIRILLSLILIIIAPSVMALSQVEASIEKNPVIEGEYFVLNITADDDLNAGALNTSALLENFIVGRTSVGRSTQMVNFNTTKETRWQVLIAAKSSGNITIPAFNIEGVSSSEIVLQVAPAGSKPQESQNLYIEASTNVDEAYVGQLINYKVKLYLAVELQRGVLSAPVVKGAQIKQIGEDTDSTEIVNGRRFRVIERNYGIVAGLPGEIIIDGATFSGDVLIETQRRGGMFGFNESIPMQTEADRKVIQINSYPPSYQGEWLVSDLVSLREVWPDTQTTFEAGSPITRTISLIAMNVDENSLPELAMPTTEGLRVYPEKPLRQTGIRDGQVISQYSLTAAIVPTKPGTYTLPELKVPWWNTQLKQQEYAILPAKTITVVAGEMAENALTITPQQPSYQYASYWPWLTGVFATLWLITLIMWRKAVSQQHRLVTTKTTQRPVADVASLATITEACDRNNVSDVISALQGYFSALLNRQVTLAEISKLSEPLSQAVTDLQQGRYSQHTKAVNKQQLMSAVKSYHPNINTPSNSVIAKLNP